jgi:hypothetical protein
VELTIVGLVFLLTGVPFIWIARRAFARDRAIARWPRAGGVVTNATLDTSKHRLTDKNTGLHSYSTYYTPSVRYTYSVGGQTFEGKNIALSVDGVATTQDAAQRFIDKYAPGTQLAVLYDPTDPKTAYLEVGRSVGGIILFAFGLFWLALGTLLLTLAVAYL